MIENLTKDNISLIDNSFLNKEIVLKELRTNPFAKYLIYLENKEVLAYLYYSDIYDRTEINMFEVRKDQRKKKIGSKLLEKFLEENNKPSTLEVKIDNNKAISMYKKYGYKEVAIRKNYYNNIDGILMERSE